MEMTNVGMFRVENSMKTNQNSRLNFLAEKNIKLNYLLCNGIFQIDCRTSVGDMNNPECVIMNNLAQFLYH